MAAEPRPVVEHDETRRVAVAEFYGPSQPPPALHRTPMEGQETVDVPRAYNLRQDRIRWGPILAGLFTALTTTLLLGLLGLAWTLTVANTTTPTSGTVLPSGTGAGSALWGAFSGIVAFFLGGYVAGWSAAAFGRKWGALNGAMVFLAGIPFLLWLAGSSLGLALGNLGALAGVLNVFPNFQPLDPADFARAADGIRNVAWWTLLGLLLALGAAAAGGAMGTRRTITVDHGRDAVATG